VGVEHEISKRELLVRYDDACVPQPHFVKACKHKNVEKELLFLEGKGEVREFYTIITSKNFNVNFKLNENIIEIFFRSDCALFLCFIKKIHMKRVKSSTIVRK